MVVDVVVDHPPIRRPLLFLRLLCVKRIEFWPSRMDQKKGRELTIWRVRVRERERYTLGIWVFAPTYSLSFLLGRRRRKKVEDFSYGEREVLSTHTVFPFRIENQNLPGAEKSKEGQINKFIYLYKEEGKERKKRKEK